MMDTQLPCPWFWTILAKGMDVVSTVEMAKTGMDDVKTKTLERQRTIPNLEQAYLVRPCADKLIRWN